MSTHATFIPPSWKRALVAGVALALVGCGGGEGAGGADAILVSPPGGALPPPLAATLGTLSVTVRDPRGDYARGARIEVQGSRSRGEAPTTLASVMQETSPVVFIDVPSPVAIRVSNSVGTKYLTGVVVKERGRTEVEVVLELDRPVTAALFPVTIPAASINPDRTELDLQVTIVASAAAPFQRAGYSSAVQTASPSLRLENCSVWVDAALTVPGCRIDTTGPASVVSFNYQTDGNSVLSSDGAPYAATLMIESTPRFNGFPSPIGPREASYYAARMFTQTLLGLGIQGPPSMSRIAPVGLFMAGEAPWGPLQLPWSIWGDPPFAQAYRSWEPSISEALSAILIPEDWYWIGRAPSGPRAMSVRTHADEDTQPVRLLDGLAAAYRLTASYAPSSRRPAVVAMVGGGDDTGLTAEQRKQALARLRQQQDASGIRTILVAARMDEASPQREELAEIMSELNGPLIISGYPRNWETERAEGMPAAMVLAADLLSGARLPTINAVFRLRTDTAARFESGTMLRGRLWIETDQCGMGCAEMPLDFAVRIP